MRKLEEYKHLLDKRWYIQSFNGTPALVHLGGMSATIFMKESLGYSYKVIIQDFREGFADMRYDRDDFHAVAHEFERRMKEDGEYLHRLINESEYAKDVVLKFIRNNHNKLYELDEEKLIESYKEYSRIDNDMLGESHVIEAYALTRDMKLRSLLLTELEEKGFGKKFLKYFTLLTKPIKKPFFVDYNNIISNIIEKIKSDAQIEKEFSGKGPEHLVKNICKNLELNKLFEKLETEFYWLHANYKEAPRLTKIDFIADVKRALKEGKTEFIPDSVFDKNLEEKIKITKELNLSRELEEIIKLIDIMTYWQDDRKKYILQSRCQLEEFLEVFSKKFNIDIKYMRYILPEEITAEKLRNIEKSFFEERMRGCFIIYENGEFEIFSGKDYKEFHKALQEKQKVKDVEEIRGMCASMGSTSGFVQICKTLEEIESFKKDNILVTGMTRPEYLPAMRKAAAIVTDEGGITSHAAVVSRELKMPCVIGTKMATKVLKNGDFVEVNANHGLVKKIVSTHVLKSKARNSKD